MTGIKWFLGILLFFGVGAGPAWGQEMPGPVTAEFLGNPLIARYPKAPFARNIWDMQKFEGRIYLGHGDTTANTGPTPVYCLDPKTKQFREEYLAPEEAILNYRVIDRQLFFPGADPRESWAYGNLYRRVGDTWTQLRTIPGGLHAYDLRKTDQGLFISFSTKDGAAVGLSSDFGKTWKTFTLPGFRAFSLFRFDRNVFATNYEKQVFVLSRDGFTEEKSRWLPDDARTPTTGEWISLFRPVSLGSRLIFIGVTIRYRPGTSLDYDPFGLYCVSGKRGAYVSQRQILPGKPYDLLFEDGVCYVLTAHRVEPTEPDASTNPYEIVVLETRDGLRWKPLLRFRAKSFARSFERTGKTFYFGLGTTAETLNEQSGDILCVKVP